MIYPRIDDCGGLVAEDQMVGHQEHLTVHHRMLFLSGIFSKEVESHNLMMALDSLSHDPIKLVITSPGGDLDSAFLFYDTMKLMQSPIMTFGRYCASTAAMLLAAGSERYLMPHAKVLIHMPSNYFEKAVVDTTDMLIIARQAEKYRDKLIDILIDCGVHRSKDEILSDMDRDFWLEPEEAIAYGLADKIMTKEKLGEWLSAK